eukprot:CAMPEP_0196754496 /NCGR_PEP_ID=MMETSP1091-20130531/94142_1 /TAXON_ID=302021 /ORGANISM="Rhodomonas sp., Strain CCMP768" /LENGTH=37 /DNA_ID= /DNA_START= /DNA_END= /DNA_ORIENTATION=
MTHSPTPSSPTTLPQARIRTWSVAQLAARTVHEGAAR